MKLGNTFTYRQSELPELSLETKGEIAALDIRIAEFILQNRGHYHALQELSEILSNCADTCELNLNSIRIIPDADPQPDRVTVKNWSEQELMLLYSQAKTSSILLVAFSKILGVPLELAAELAYALVSGEEIRPSLNQVKNYVNHLVEAWEKREDAGFDYEELIDSDA